MFVGIVIKHNANRHNATISLTFFLLKEVTNISIQDFVVRIDMGYGSPIGPILASGVGFRTVYCGILQIFMHSVH